MTAWRVLMVALLFGCLAMFNASAAEGHDDREAAEEDREEDEVFEDEEIGDEEFDNEEKEEPELLDRTYRLEFALLPRDDNNKFWLLCATSRYHLEMAFRGEEGEFVFSVNGHLRHMDKEELELDNDALLLTYEVTMGYEGGEGEGSFSTEGSAFVPIGKSVHLAQMGEKTLAVRITVFNPDAKVKPKGKREMF